MTTQSPARIPSTLAVDLITYDLNKRLPEIRQRGCTIDTAYGELVIEAHEAGPIADAVAQLLYQRLRLAKRAAQDEGIADGRNVCGGAL